jgi:hypothetical protein
MSKFSLLLLGGARRKKVVVPDPKLEALALPLSSSSCGFNDFQERVDVGRGPSAAVRLFEYREEEIR